MCLCVCERHRGRPSSKSCSQTCSRPRKQTYRGFKSFFSKKNFGGLGKFFFIIPGAKTIQYILYIYIYCIYLGNLISLFPSEMINLPPVEMEPACQILRVQVQKSLSFTEEFLSFILMEKTFGPTKSFLGGTKLLGAPKVFFLTSSQKPFKFQAPSPNILRQPSTPLLLFHTQKLRRYRCAAAAASAGALKCSETSITGYVINFKINLGDVALIWPETLQCVYYQYYIFLRKVNVATLPFFFHATCFIGKPPVKIPCCSTCF